MRSALVSRMQPYATSIFAEMSMLAAETGAINLGQGFPDTDGPEEMKEAARAAITEGRGNQIHPSTDCRSCDQRSVTISSASTALRSIR